MARLWRREGRNIQKLWLFLGQLFGNRVVKYTQLQGAPTGGLPSAATRPALLYFCQLIFLIWYLRIGLFHSMWNTLHVFPHLIFIQAINFLIPFHIVPPCCNPQWLTGPKTPTNHAFFSFFHSVNAVLRETPVSVVYWLCWLVPGIKLWSCLVFDLPFLFQSLFCICALIQQRWFLFQ